MSKIARHKHFDRKPRFREWSEMKQNDFNEAMADVYRDLNENEDKKQALVPRGNVTVRQSRCKRCRGLEASLAGLKQFEATREGCDLHVCERCNTLPEPVHPDPEPIKQSKPVAPKPRQSNPNNNVRKKKEREWLWEDEYL